MKTVDVSAVYVYDYSFEIRSMFADRFINQLPLTEHLFSSRLSMTTWFLGRYGGG